MPWGISGTMTDPTAQDAMPAPARPETGGRDPGSADERAGKITVTMGSGGFQAGVKDAPTGGQDGGVAKSQQQAQRPQQPQQPQQPQRPPPGLQALLDLRAEVHALRGTVAGLADRVGPTSSAADEDADPKALTEAVRALEGYVSLTFFDRLRTTLGEVAETDPRPAALEKRLRRLRRLVWVLVLMQGLGLAGLGLLVRADPLAMTTLDGMVSRALDALPSIGSLSDGAGDDVGNR